MNSDHTQHWLEALQIEATKLQLSLSAKQANLCLSHCMQLLHWNRAHNLTSIDHLQDMLSLHVLDSLAVLPFIHHAVVLDIGTGGGFPGIPLAIVNPDRIYVLIDANLKKISFLRQLVYELQLENVIVEHSRIETFSRHQLNQQLQRRVKKESLKEDQPVTLIARAFAEAESVLPLVKPWLDASAELLLMKGKKAESELKFIPEGYNTSIFTLNVPLLEQERYLLTIYKQR